ncbi:DNA-binding response regulator [Flavobacterium branchiophilum NBRC 15030 = ATCC 35035]|uniref:Two-component system response regulatory protein, LuxR family n=2 Tax=Flavobacterium branchiophilum TaxID=55197 RepID=G2Z328_FLABF|nr:response regulator transcription factor [Flavobacterium branchiophilum]OXA80659.1 DNA-binding response regulator [Flavobacterium branchiophilum NBRC 15030 = ATCC 35035]PDS26517.1 DNA-binding response regulator [Flavobacterium branchiophilum]TQM41469.1 LuxR family two component transcriptional regulator [Flavobacterium branchiophilum]CCB70370.1 Two-component system response regulatory protein, LuxR family [Flavobacterium branchiophilum FL-15]GEM54170.1 helix-turn-helix transcriptional regula
MIKVCIADNFPIVHYATKAYFKDSIDVTLVANVNSFAEAKAAITQFDYNVLVIDLNIHDLSSILEIKAMLKDDPQIKVVIYSALSENMYAPNALKIGVKGYVSKTEPIEKLRNAIIRVAQGEIFVSDDILETIETNAKTPKSERLFKKLSTREIEVLRYFSAGKKNKEIAQILDLNEKTIGTYKLRLLQKLDVTNLVDLVHKAKDLKIV